MPRAPALLLCLLGAAAAQQAGTRNTEGAPQMGLRECAEGGNCTTARKSVVLDANWRWVHAADGWENCYTGNEWSPKYCTDPAVCAQNCSLEAVTSAEYAGTYGVTELPEGLQLKFVTKGQYGANYGSRLYLMEDAERYRLFKLKNREFSIDVDVSKLPCGLNGAVYFAEMEETGNMGGGNKAGAAYGTGYCDAQCPHDIKWINGEANLESWDAKITPPVGRYGTCCSEMDIWEANSMATAYTPHPCKLEGQQRCEGLECGDNAKQQRYQGVCDKDGCDFNPYRMGNRSFYGTGDKFAVDTTKPFSVVTQFLTENGTDEGDLSEIRRFYVQDGVAIPNSNATVLGENATNSITDMYCDATKQAFGDTNDFKAKGSLKQMGSALGRGMVFIMSLWDDTLAHMLWLDSAYPTNASASAPGVQRGPCPGGEKSAPSHVRATYPEAAVQYMNLAFGPIGSTTSAGRPSKGGRRLGAVLV